MKNIRLKFINLFFFGFFSLTLASSVIRADDYLVLDGLGGVWMKGVTHDLRDQGHRAVHRRWFAWRSAVRQFDGPVNIIGYSLGGSRAVMAAQRLPVNQLQLLDPVLRHGTIVLPHGIDTTVYRAGAPRLIRSNPVYGNYQEYVFPTDHGGMPAYYRR